MSSELCSPFLTQQDAHNSTNCLRTGAEEAEVVLRLRQDVRQWQSAHGRRVRFSYLCERWVGVACDIEEKQRLKRM